MDSEMILDFSDYSTAYERILNKWKCEKSRSPNANPNDFADLCGPFSKQLCKRYRITMSSVMSFRNLNCLYNILKYVFTYEKSKSFALEKEHHWICPQFKEFYDKMLLKDKLQKIATIKTVSLNEDKDILDEIIQRNINIDAVYGEYLTNSDLSAIDFFPGIKRLKLRSSRITGKYINELTDLEVLHLEDIEGLLPKNLSLIFKNNELRVLKLLRVPGAFTEHLSYEISQNLMKQGGEYVQQLEELAISLVGTGTGWQMLGCLRYLRKLEIYISDDWSRKCEFKKYSHFFNALSNNMNLQELEIIKGIVTQDDFNILAVLRNLKKLTIHLTYKLHLRDFHRLSHLAELHLLYHNVYMKEFMEILRCCPQLTLCTFRSIIDLKEYKYDAAIEMIKAQNRYKLPVTVRVLSLKTECLRFWGHTHFLVIKDFIW